MTPTLPELKECFCGTPSYYKESVHAREQAILEKLKEGQKYLQGHVCRNGDHAWSEIDWAIKIYFEDLIKELERK